MDLLSLFAKFGGRRLDSFTPRDLAEIASQFNINVTPEQIDGFKSFIGEDGADKLSAWITTPGNADRLKAYLQPRTANDPIIAVCPHCWGMFTIEIGTPAIGSGAPSASA